MAFDQTTRNRLQSFVSKARAILSEEFTRQLQATYGLDPNQGTIADIESLSHLDNYQLQTAHILRDTVQHYMTTTVGKTQKEQVKLVLERIVREQAFTVLNRLAALRMAEARGFLLESIGSGYSSQGFQLYQMLEDGSHGETGDAYQSYLFSLFDEFGLDLAVLFDRFSVQGRLFPRETALLQLLEQINDYEIEPLWAEDETIGWIYQYFNSQEERKKMRSESSAPRNSRELAVRNQFFTPRYVVEFLTDNTLGRIWYEMTKSNTALVDSCQYLVKRPNEVFLSQGENSPTQNESNLDENLEALTQEEVLNQSVYIPHRPLKDPRTIRMLDPACGSMHFGLYAFDLFERIYIEAWQIEAEQGADVFERESDLVSLHSTFEDIESFKQQIPKLIIEHNIHGVDIDPRAVQIAGLSLWQRAQRAWHEQGVKPNQRPTIVKSNIVCAEPMPGEQDLLKEFTSTLNPPALGQLVEVIFEKMTLAGEAGTLLKIEQEIESAISKARQQWDKTKDVNGGIRDLFEEELLAATPQQQLGFDLSGIDDEAFWEDAEQLILQALKNYSEQATSAAGEKRLFAEDAAKGFAFIDLSRKQFDVVLMNPPFGESAQEIKKYLDVEYVNWNKNILCAFLERASQLGPQALIASVIDRSFLNKSTYESFRKAHLLHNNRLETVLDLGWGVLDGANVEVSSIVIKGCNDVGTNHTAFIDLRDEELNSKESILKSLFMGQLDANKLMFLDTEGFLSFPNSVIANDLTPNLLKLFKAFKSLEESGYPSYTGHQLQSSRHFFLHWEVPQDKLFEKDSDYSYLYNGGEYSRFIQSPKEVVAFGRTEELTGSDVKDYTFVLRNKDKHRQHGVFFGKRGDYLDAHIVPRGFIFTVEGQGCPTATLDEALLVSAVLNSTLASRLLATYSGQHKYSGYVNLLPFISTCTNEARFIQKYTKEITELKLKYYFWDESSLVFSQRVWDSFEDVGSLKTTIEKDQSRYEQLNNEIDQLVLKAFEVNDEQSLLDLKDFSLDFQRDKSLTSELFNNQDLKDFIVNDFLSHEVGIIFERWHSYPHTSKPNMDLANYFSDDLVLGASYKIQRSDVDIDVIDIHRLVKNLRVKIYDKTILPNLINSSKRLSETLGLINLEDYFSQSKYFFDAHLKKYSLGRKQAPIYWPLQTPSGSYTLWLYYHKLNSQTLYSCVNDFVEPKLTLVTEDLNALSNKSNRSSIEEKELTKLTDLQSELKDFRDELLRLAKIWKPNLNDGVQITAAPLWKLFQHTAWQKKLKETWEKLEEGEYDWAHLAASMWPDRVLRKCHQDRSLAIAHDVEDVFWQEVEVPIMRGKKPTGKTKLEWQPVPASENMLNDMVNEAKARLQ